MIDTDGINRFLEAQKGDYEMALAEVTAGETQSHCYGGKHDVKTRELLNR